MSLTIAYNPSLLSTTTNEAAPVTNSGHTSAPNAPVTTAAADRVAGPTPKLNRGVAVESRLPAGLAGEPAAMMSPEFLALAQKPSQTGDATGLAGEAAVADGVATTTAVIDPEVVEQGLGEDVGLDGVAAQHEGNEPDNDLGIVSDDKKGKTGKWTNTGAKEGGFNDLGIAIKPNVVQGRWEDTFFGERANRRAGCGVFEEGDFRGSGSEQEGLDWGTFVDGVGGAAAAVAYGSEMGTLPAVAVFGGGGAGAGAVATASGALVGAACAGVLVGTLIDDAYSAASGSSLGEDWYNWVLGGSQDPNPTDDPKTGDAIVIGPNSTPDDFVKPRDLAGGVEVEPSSVTMDDATTAVEGHVTKDGKELPVQDGGKLSYEQMLKANFWTDPTIQ
jgi:hypothetical protein